MTAGFWIESHPHAGIEGDSQVVWFEATMKIMKPIVIAAGQ